MSVSEVFDAAALADWLEALPDSVTFKDGEGRWRVANAVARELFRLDGRHWEGCTDAELMARYPDIAQALRVCQASDAQAWAQGGMVRSEERVVMPDGEVRHYDVVKVARSDAQGRRLGLLVIGRDISHQRRAEERLRLASKVLETTSEGVMITDAAGTIIEVNAACCAISGYRREEMIGKNPRMHQSGRHDRAFYEAMWASILSTGHWAGEVWNRRKDGSIYPKWLSINALENERGEISHYVGVFMDISRQKRVEEELQHLAYYDPLTALANRALLIERASQALRQAERSGRLVALMFIDLDRFKDVNDTLGHPVGDELLIAVAARLSAAVRRMDTVARLGGDEFVVLLPELEDGEGAMRVARGILEAMQESFEIGGMSLAITPSIGVALYPQDGKEVDTLMRNADNAMYHAKNAGRNTCRFFSPEMDEEAHERFVIERDLRLALGREEFELYFQPQLDSARQRVIGAEALLRWRHPQRGLLSPAHFLPIAEESGLIIPIGEWVLHEACAQARRWADAGMPIRVAVNLSAQQFRRGNIAQTVRAALEAAGLPAERLELELTESMLLHPTADVLARLGELNALGVRLSLDDFGTGYSSLNYLKRYPIDQLKIDRSFVEGVESKQEDRAIIRAIQSLAEALGQQTIAEGVETADQSAAVRAIGCYHQQGYLFGRPMPAEEFTAWMQSQSSPPA